MMFDLSKAIEKNDLESVKSLLKDSKNNVNVVAENSGLLFSMVVEFKDEALLDLLLNHEGVDVNCGYKNHSFFANYKKAMTQFGLKKKLAIIGEAFEDNNVDLNSDTVGWGRLEKLVSEDKCRIPDDCTELGA